MSLEGNDDDYAFTLGDEMRGRRADLGLTLDDAQRDLRIRAGTILAIENGDLSGFPSEGVIPGYVRSYARYLGMEPQRSYRRFCDETGFRSQATASGRAGGRSGARASGADLTKSRFAPPPAPDRIGSRVPLGAVGSAVALVALVGGLSFGGYQLLQDIQKVGVAPLPEVPEAVVEAQASPEDAIRVATAEAGGVPRPDASAYEDGGILTLAQAADPLPPRLTSRDGPIADLDPNDIGLFAGVNQLDPHDPRRDSPPSAEVASAEPEEAPETPSEAGWDDGVLLASLSAQSMSTEPATDAERLTMSARAETQALRPQSRSTVVQATEEAWIRVRDGAGTVVFEGILAPGETFELPERMEAPEIRAGNAGGVFVAIGGETFGPIGAPGQVVRDVSLEEDDVRESFPVAEGIEPASVDTAPAQRAQATL